MSDDDNIEIQEAENYRGGKEEAFSHTALIMKAMKKCIEAGSKEMRTGWFNEKVDRSGNIVRTYVEDTRLAFIESVKSLLMIMSSDFDKTFKSAKSNVSVRLSLLFSIFIQKEKEYWEGLHYKDKEYNNSQGIYQITGYLNKRLPFYQEYLDDEAKAYRDLFAECSKQTSRLDYFKDEEFTG